jgi:hypothetical protein
MLVDDFLASHDVSDVHLVKGLLEVTRDIAERGWGP